MRTSLPPLNALCVFQVAAKYNSFAKAAEFLHLTPAAVAYQIKQLEEAIGVPLFERKARGINLNRAGMDYWQATSPILENIAAETARLTNQYGDHRSTIHLCTLHAIAEKWLLPRLATYESPSNDSINTLAVTQLSQEDMAQADICISYQTKPSDEFVVVELMQEWIIPVYSNVLHPLNHHDLTNYPWLYDSDWGQDWHIWQTAQGQTPIQPKQRLEFSLYSLVIDAAVKNMGIAMGRWQLIQTEVANQQLKYFDQEPVLLPHAYYVFAHPDKLKKTAVKNLFDWLISHTKS